MTSLGKLACEIQTPVATLQQVIERLNIKPAQRLNGIAYFDADDVNRIAENVCMPVAGSTK
ncbi:hypothetical protein [Rhodopirellula bahusiensis]|uniref:hypothetical protein n=1 Tax=Rhodopirellula bahusiensis TaxID=2014065 RepID=UPI0032639BAB